MDEQDMQSLLLTVLPGKASNANEVIDIEPLEDGEGGAIGVLVLMSDGEEFCITVDQYSVARAEVDDDAE